MYFGLVLAGSAPHVLASAAMARQFDVRDEIEYRDDLDTKPDDKVSPVEVSVHAYLEDVDRFLTALAQQTSAGRADLAKSTFNVAGTASFLCLDSCIGGSFLPVRSETSNEALRPAVESFSKTAGGGYSFGDCVKTTDDPRTRAVDSSLTATLDGSELKVTVTVKKSSHKRAVDLKREIEKALDIYTYLDTRSRLAPIARNTVIEADNGHLKINLTLPRGSLPSLPSEVK